MRTCRPLLGGVLSRPRDRWPNHFSHPFWGEYPYFLPCLATVTYSLLAFSLAAIFLKEVGFLLVEECHAYMFAQTVNSDRVTKPNAEANSDLPEVGEGEILDGPAKGTEEPLPLRALLTRPVVVSVANYGVTAMLDITAGTLISLIWSTLVEFGGLSMSPASIGLWMVGYGFMNCIVPFVAFPRIVTRFGPRRVCIASVLCYFPIYLMFPFENLALRGPFHDLNPAVGLLMALHLLAASFSVMGSGKSLSTLHCVRSLKWCDLIRCDIHVHIHRRSQRAISRRYERTRANDSFDSARGRTCCCRVAVCILIGE